MNIILILVILLSFFFVMQESYAQEMILIFERPDWGEGLSKQDCKERTNLIQTNFEPDEYFAKFKAENHPAFKKTVEEKTYTFDHSGVRAINYSENCKGDIPVFELQYMIDRNETSHTRMYVTMDYVSYDVLQIATRFTEGFYPDLIYPEPIPFLIKNWKEIQIPGEFTNSDPPIPPKTFKIPYVVTNGEIKDIQGNLGTIRVDLASNGEGKFALKIPRNYPYTDHDDTQHPGHGLQVFPIFEPRSQEGFVHVTKSDCFYDAWIPFSKNSTIEFNFRYSYLQDEAFHGDKDIPRYCLAKTIVDKSLDEISKRTPLKQVKAGVFPYDVSCKEWLLLVVNHDEKPACVSQVTASNLFEREWIDKSTNIYKKYGDAKVQEQFKEKFISKEEAIESAKEFIKQTHLKLDIDSSEIQITANPAYAQLSKGGLYLLGIDFTTGLPTEIIPPWGEIYYRTPGWYNELQKDYLGINNTRVDDGEIYWQVTYRTCLDCIASYPLFFVNPIDGKVERTLGIESLFNPSYE